MRFPRLPLLALCLALFGPARAAEPGLAAGSRVESLRAGDVTYLNVEIRSVTARSVFITHSKGMTSIRLRDLTPELQQRFDYDPAADVDVPASAKPPKSSQKTVNRERAAPVTHSKVESLLREFGRPVVVHAEVDLRPRFFELELGVKNQGRRPSCAIFAIVSSLEFQNADLAGRAEKFSEEYLTWATRKITRRPPVGGAAEGAIESDEDADEGFTLAEVVAALRGYGIPLQSTMPNTFGKGITAIEDPAPAIVTEARNHQKVFIHALPGRDNPTRISNIVHVLNRGMPVSIGMAWPNYRSLRHGHLSAQTPVEGSGHAVTLVGYTSQTGQLEDAVFIFKNSWGTAWGQGGYGRVTYAYLAKHLHETVLLEVQSGTGSVP